MIQDLDQLPRDTSIDCDVCVVGSGAAGLALAVHLLDSGLRVVMAESGGFGDEPRTQALYDAEITGKAFPGATEGRFRIYGGSTTRWGGASQPLDPIDFEPREWVPQSGWPIGYEDLRTAYARAAAFMRTDALNYDTDLFALLGATPPAFGPDTIGYYFHKSAPRPNLRDVHGPRLRAAADVTVLLHANVTRIELTDTLDRVRRLHVRSLDGAAATIAARVVVLCTGAIETARMLLDNDAQQAGGIGNARGLVGRYLMDHPVARVGTLRAADGGERLQRLFNTFYRRGQKYTVRLPVAEGLLRRERILNAAAIVKFEVPETSAYRQLKDAVVAAKRGRVGLSLARAVARAAVHAPSILRPAWAYAVRGRGYTPRPAIHLAVTTEQEPNPDSRVTLADQRDALGVRKARIDWRLSDATLRTMSACAAAVADEFGRLGLAELEIEDWLARPAADWRDAVGDQYHPMGTARMGDSPERGVVDRDCRVHGVDNLFVAGSAVFPTGGQAGPTLTIIALAIRLADKIREIRAGA